MSYQKPHSEGGISLDGSQVMILSSRKGIARFVYVDGYEETYDLDSGRFVAVPVVNAHGINLKAAYFCTDWRSSDLRKHWTSKWKNPNV